MEKDASSGPNRERIEPQNLDEIEKRASTPGFREALCQWSEDHPEATIQDIVLFARGWNPDKDHGAA